MDPPEETRKQQRRTVSPQQRRYTGRATLRHVKPEFILIFIILFGILSILKSHSLLAKNDAAQNQKNEIIDLPQFVTEESSKLATQENQNNLQHQPSFCGRKQYGSTKFTCNQRVEYLCWKHHISEQEAKNNLLESKDCICDCLWGYKEDCTYSSLESEDCICDDDNNEDDIMMPRAPVEKSWGDGRWQRMLIGIFSYDSMKEFELRMANRETHLHYFKHIAGVGDDYIAICSLHQFLGDQNLIADKRQCRIIYTFVMGGGPRDDDLTKQNVNGLDLGAINQTVKTRCLWQDPECGGTDIDEWTVDAPQSPSIHLQEEIKTNKDITFLSISENHQLGKSDTWFTYAAMLTKSRPDLDIRFTAKLDSDNFLNYYALQSHMLQHKQRFRDKQYIYGGFVIYKGVCSGRTYGYVCRDPQFIAPIFMAGAFTYLSTPLAQHVYLNGTSLERKKEVWIPLEDMQIGNMAYSDPSITVEIVQHNKLNGPYTLNKHCSSDPSMYRREFAKWREKAFFLIKK